MNMRRSDVVVVGAGVVGSATALALADAGLSVTLVEAREPQRWQAQQRDLRVFAFAPDNAQLLQALDTWSDVLQARAHPYRRMHVWDAAGGAPLVFEADLLGRRELGWIIENRLLIDRLYARLPAAGVDVLCPARIEGFEQDADGVRLRLDDGRQLRARLAVAADGAASALRRMAGIEVAAHDYRQRGVVAYLRSEQPHADTAWQRFLPGGPLALLPCSDGLISIVWSLPEDEAQRMLEVNEDSFNQALTRASDRRLGQLQLASERAAFPLRRQLATTQLQGRLLLVGDAAHAMHPLAGQGVNLGLRDVAALRASVLDARQRGVAFDHPQRLARWARSRRSDNTVSALAFEQINRIYSTDAPLPTLLRRPLLGVAGRIPPLTRALWRHAAGL